MEKTYYSENSHRERLQLSDNRIEWDLGNAMLKTSKVFDTRYDIARHWFTRAFEGHYHVEVYFCGRSGRHVCVEDNAENRRKYDHMENAVRIMQHMIVAIAADNGQWLEIHTRNTKIPQWILAVYQKATRYINNEYPF